MPHSITITDLDQETFELLKAAARRCGVDVDSFAGSALKLLLKAFSDRASTQQTGNSGSTQAADPSPKEFNEFVEEFGPDLIGRTAKEHQDLNSLAGTWSDSDFEEFHAAISDFEKVDEGMWQ